MRTPKVTLPRTLIAVAIVAAIGFALALPNLFDGSSASETPAVVIGERGEPRDRPVKSEQRQRDRRDVAKEKRKAGGEGAPKLRGAEEERASKGAVAPPSGSGVPYVGSSAGPVAAGGGGGGGGSGGGAPPAPTAAPPAVTPVPDDDVEDDDGDDASDGGTDD